MPNVNVASKKILLAMAVTVAVTAIGNMRKDKKRTPDPRILIGGFAATIMLLVASEFSDDIPEGLAILSMIATLVGPNGEATWDMVNNISKKAPTLPASVQI